MDLAMFTQHMGEFEFQNGQKKGSWGLHSEDLSLSWPKAIIWIQTSLKYSKDDKTYFRLLLDKYPSQAPTMCPWDIEKDASLAPEGWPTGYEDLNAVFKPSWNGATSLYCPFDRLAMPGHAGPPANWETLHPSYWWKSSFKITQYLTYVHRLLNR